MAHRVFLIALARPSDLIFPPPAVRLLGVLLEDIQWGIEPWNGHLFGKIRVKHIVTHTHTYIYIYQHVEKCILEGTYLFTTS